MLIFLYHSHCKHAEMYGFAQMALLCCLWGREWDSIPSCRFDACPCSLGTLLKPNRRCSVRAQGAQEQLLLFV